MKVWWAPFLCRGKLHVEVFDSEFPGEVPEGAAQLVEKVRAAVNIRFQQAASKPDLIFVDRCWEETRQEYSTRLKRCCEHINDEHDVDALCRAFPKRCKKLDDAQGGRLSY